MRERENKREREKRERERDREIKRERETERGRGTEREGKRVILPSKADEKCCVSKRRMSDDKEKKTFDKERWGNTKRLMKSDSKDK